jgi:hypothetical protein
MIKECVTFVKVRGYIILGRALITILPFIAGTASRIFCNPFGMFEKYGF